VTTIEWTQRTINPSTGCDQVSPGCDNCYAKTMAARLKGMGQAKYQTDGDPRTSGPGFGFAMHPAAMQAALKRKTPTTWFVNSMSDLFHAKATRPFLAQTFAAMSLTPQHTYQILTKRPLRMRRVLADPAFPEMVTRSLLTEPAFSLLGRWPVPEGGIPWPLPNVHLGVSVEDQERAEERIPHLQDTPAAVRFLSCEPLLGPLALRELYPVPGRAGFRALLFNGSVLGGNIHWVIVGGESGPGARPMRTEWAQRIVDDCRAAGVPAFVKQLGTVLGGKNHHDIDTFPAGLQHREYPTAVPV
jgi:protein gp37